MPTITAIVPTYNRPKLLVRAISTIREQTWKDIRIVVRDNCSNDNTGDVVAEITKQDSRVIYVKNKENVGISQNIRLGIKNVETQYFSFLCDDDYLEPGFYSEAIRLFEKYPEAGFVAFRVNTVDINGGFLNSNMEDYGGQISELFYSSDVGLKSYLRGKLPYTMTGYVFKKSVAESIDFGDFSEVGYGADIFFIWRAASRFNFVVSNFLGGNYTAHDNSTSATLVNVFDERFLYWWRNRLNIIMSDPLISDVVKSNVSEYYFSNSTKSFKSLQYYTHSAIILIMDRVRNGRLKELKADFIAMRSFVPWSILIGIKYCIVTLVFLKLDVISQNFIRRVRGLF
jgi:glycosyltransferase involved in cell wall biosynthesis